MRSASLVVIGIAAASACNALTGVDDVEFGQGADTAAPSGGSASTSASGATNGSGAAGGATSASAGGATTTSGTASSSSGAGGGPRCSASLADCDNDPENGCETDTSTHVDHCGACGRACTSTGVASLACAGGLCTSACEPGFANCVAPVAPSGDDGCETSAKTPADCGGCGNACPPGFICEQSGGPALGWHCGCDGNATCGGGDKGSCQGAGNCDCGPNCALGEVCDSAADDCICNGGAACPQSQTCCAAPAGCVAVATDAQNCGACGHACPPGFVCQSGLCSCDTDAACDAGTEGPFSCAGGLCACGPVICGSGKRCQPGGSCG